MRILMVIGMLTFVGDAEPAQQAKGDVFPPVVKGVEYRLKYGLHPDQGWQDGLRFDFSREECLRRLGDLPPPVVCMIRPETTSL